MSVSIDQNDKVHRKIPQLRNSIAFPGSTRWASPPPFRSYWYKESLYALAEGVDEKNEDGSYFTRWVFARWLKNEEEWQILGDYKTDTKELLEAIPCDNDRLIVISLNNDLTGNIGYDRTPFARMSIHPDKKELRLDSSIYHGQDELMGYMSTPDGFGLAWSSNIIVTGDYATLVSRSTGLYWIFSLEKASLVRVGNIFKKMTPAMIANGGFTNAILCVNPEKEGTVLISAQQEDFFIKANDPYKQKSEFREKFEVSDDEAMEMFWHYYWEHLDRSPFVAWYRIYPETGKVEKLREHPEGGTWFRSDIKNDAWRPLPDGSVKLNWIWNQIELVDGLKQEFEKKEREENNEPLEPTANSPHVLVNADVVA